MSSNPSTFQQEVYLAWYPTGPLPQFQSMPKRQWNILTIRWAVIPPRVDAAPAGPKNQTPNQNPTTKKWTSGVVQIRIQGADDTLPPDKRDPANPSNSVYLLRSWSEPYSKEEDTTVTRAPPVLQTILVPDWEEVLKTEQVTKAGNISPIFFNVRIENSKIIIRRWNGSAWVLFYDKLGLTCAEAESCLKANVDERATLCIMAAEWRSSLGPDIWQINSAIVTPPVAGPCPSLLTCPQGYGCFSIEEFNDNKKKADQVCKTGSACHTDAEINELKSKQCAGTDKRCLSDKEIVASKPCQDALNRVTCPSPINTWWWVAFIALAAIIFYQVGHSAGKQKGRKTAAASYSALQTQQLMASQRLPVSRQFVSTTPTVVASAHPL